MPITNIPFEVPVAANPTTPPPLISESPVTEAALRTIISGSLSRPTSPESFVLPPPPDARLGASAETEHHPLNRQNSYAPVPSAQINSDPPNIMCTQSGRLISGPPESIFSECVNLPTPPEREHSYVPVPPPNQAVYRTISTLILCEDDQIHQLIDSYLSFDGLERGPLIGEGRSSFVFELVHTKNASVRGVIKILKADDGREAGNVAIANRHYIEDFGDHLALPIRHPAILGPERCLYFSDLKIGENPVPGARIIAQILPYFEGTTLKVAIEQGLTTQEIRSLAYEIVDGLAHLNASRIIHGDFHPDNILVKNGKAKIIDYGLSHRILNDDGNDFSKGKICYQAPEVVLEDYHTEKAEAWSFGVILYQMIHQGKVPFYNAGEILNGPLWIDRKTPPDLELLIRLLLDRDPKTRLTIYKAREYLQKRIIGEMPKFKTD